MSKLNAKQMRLSVVIPTILNPYVLCNGPVVLSSSKSGNAREKPTQGRQRTIGSVDHAGPHACHLSKAAWLDLRA